MARVVAIACLVVLLGAALRVAVHDPTSEPVSGDQASFVYQALSLRGGDLAYDETDQARWLELDWAEQPHGLFAQKRDDGWAFAKPLGYSVLLAPAMALYDAQGIALVNAALVLAYAGCWYGLGRLRWGRATALAVATAATVASHAWLFGFPAHADLFVAVLVGVAALGAARVVWPDRHGDRTSSADLCAERVHESPEEPQVLRAAGQGDHVERSGAPSAVPGTTRPPQNGLWLLLSAAAAALLVTEKLPALVALAPLLVLAVVRAPGRARLMAGSVGLVVLAATVAPYLFYSDGASWSAYGGDRYYALNITPWSGGTDADLTPWQTRDSLSPAFVLDQVTDPSEDLPSAALTYGVGRHTGLLTFEPLSALLLLAAAIASIAGWRHRRAGRSTMAQQNDATGIAPPVAPHGSPPRQVAPSSQLGVSEPTMPAARVLADDREQTRAPASVTAARSEREWRSSALVAGAAALGLVGYVVLYLVVFTDNYFGGGQSIGNRYFLQISPLVALVAAAAPVSARVARWCAAGAAVWALVFLHPLLRSPEEAYFHIERTSAAQRLLPFDGSQKHSWRFDCEPAECIPPPLEAFEG